MWKVCITLRRYRLHNFAFFHILIIKCSKYLVCNFQTFQSGLAVEFEVLDVHTGLEGKVLDVKTAKCHLHHLVNLHQLAATCSLEPLTPAASRMSS
jgi:hypothetical protein